jgi:thiol-disulfide isomerase/thioredoxin
LIKKSLIKKDLMKSACKLAFVALLCVVASAVAVAEEYQDPTMAPLKPGDVLASLRLPGLDGALHDISRSDRGGPVGIFFWSVFCSNCKEAMPGLVRIHNEWKDKGLTIWAVNVDGARFSNAVESFVRDSDFPLTVVYDVLEGEVLRAADPLGVDKTPTLYLADAEGWVLYHQAAAIDMEAVEKVLAALQP